MSGKKIKTGLTVGEIKNKILRVGKGETKIFMPNEIFKDLTEAFMEEDRAKSSTHIAYAYSYTYLAHYMYRYCKYEYPCNYHNTKEIDEKEIKKILGFPEKSDQYTYISKKNGVLQSMGYIRKESDIPIKAIIVNAEGSLVLEREIKEQSGIPIEFDLMQAAANGGVFEIYNFTMSSDYKEENENSKNRKINYPVKAFVRENEWAEVEMGSEYGTGTFWYIENTHMVDIHVFIFCMSDEKLGVKSFYLYSYLVYMTDKHPEGFDCSIQSFEIETGLGIRTVRDHLMRMEQRNMITNDQKPFCLDKKEWQKTKVNTYTVLAYENFVSSPVNYNQIPKQRRISADRYEKEIGFVTYDTDNGDSLDDETFDISVLPKGLTCS